MGNFELVKKECIEIYDNNYCSGHGKSHAFRVEESSYNIGREENANLDVLGPAGIGHDIGYSAEKKTGENHAIVSSRMIKPILVKADYSDDLIKQITYAIEVHRFTDGIYPNTLEAKILQDADRLDAIGVIGFARAFEWGGANDRSTYNSESFFAKNGRRLDDSKWTVDHFVLKLLNLDELMHTETAKRIAKERIQFMYDMLERMELEIKGSA